MLHWRVSSISIRLNWVHPAYSLSESRQAQGTDCGLQGRTTRPRTKEVLKDLAGVKLTIWGCRGGFIAFDLVLGIQMWKRQSHTQEIATFWWKRRKVAVQEAWVPWDGQRKMFFFWCYGGKYFYDSWPHETKLFVPICYEVERIILHYIFIKVKYDMMGGREVCHEFVIIEGNRRKSMLSLKVQVSRISSFQARFSQL